MSERKEVQQDAFPDLVSPSPKLAWLEKHQLTTTEQPLPRSSIGPRNSMPWVCQNKSRTIAIFGEDETDATLEYAKIMGLKHYLLEQPMAETVQQIGEEW